MTRVVELLDRAADHVGEHSRPHIGYRRAPDESNLVERQPERHLYFVGEPTHLHRDTFE